MYLEDDVSGALIRDIDLTYALALVAHLLEEHLVRRRDFDELAPVVVTRLASLVCH